MNIGQRREVNIPRRLTARQFLQKLGVEPIDCDQANAIYSRLETADENELEHLGAHLVTIGVHDPMCPHYDPSAQRVVASRIQDGPSSP